MILTITNLKKYFGGIRALDGATINVAPGKITALIGPNGCGKTTLFNTLLNLEQKDEGTIIFNKENISNLPTHNIIKKGIARTFQEVRLFKNLSIQEHFDIVLNNDNEKLFKNIFSPARNNETTIKKYLAQVNLNKPLTTYAIDLSYGQRKLLDLALALALPHKILLLDEPVAGINPELRIIIKDILKKLRTQGETILLIEHDMNFVMDLADHIIVLDEGKKLVEGTPKKIQDNPHVLEACLGD